MTDEDVLGAICRWIEKGRALSVTLENLAAQLGCGVPDLVEPIASLVAGGLVDDWPTAPKGPSVALSVATCKMQGLNFEEPRPRIRQSGRVFTEADLPAVDLRARSGLRAMDQIEDPKAVDPSEGDLDEDLDPLPKGMTKKASQRADYLHARPPKPRVLLGQRLQWPVPGQRGTNSTGPCVGCRDDRRRWEYCLVCDLYEPVDMLKDKSWKACRRDRLFARERRVS